jgi:chloride channel protein, CIC family
LRLAHTEALPLLAVLGVVSGFATGLIAVAFRLGIELPLKIFLPGHDSAYFEGLSLPARMLLPLIGAAIVALIFHFSRKSARDVSVGHVIERYQKHQARLPLRNAVLHFFGGIIVAVSPQQLRPHSTRLWQE